MRFSSWLPRLLPGSRFKAARLKREESLEFADWLAILAPVVLALSMMIIENFHHLIDYFRGHPSVQSPFHQRIHRRLLILFNSWVLFNFEHAFEFDSTTHEIDCPFHIGREPIVIEVHLGDPNVLSVDRLIYQADGEWRTGSFGRHILKKKDLHVVEIYPADLVLADHLKARLPDRREQHLKMLRIRTTPHPLEDAEVFLLGLDGRFL